MAGFEGKVPACWSQSVIIGTTLGGTRVCSSHISAATAIQQPQQQQQKTVLPGTASSNWMLKQLTITVSPPLKNVSW